MEWSSPWQQATTLNHLSGDGYRATDQTRLRTVKIESPLLPMPRLVSPWVHCRTHAIHQRLHQPDHPSPFSRRGPGPGMLVKPDVVHYGGTCASDGQPVGGIRGPYRNGIPLEAIGTSFAAPRVAAQLAQLVGFLPEPEPELLKLLLLLSCTSRGDHDADRRESVNYYGFGVPESPVAILSCNPWECTVLLHGDIRPGRTLHVPFPFPPSLEDHQQRRGSVRIALVYTPFLDSSKGSEYCQTNLTASFGRQFDYPPKDSRRYKREIPPLPQKGGTGAQQEEDLIEHGWKWSPTKVYERTFTRMQIHPKEIGWRLSLELLH